MFGTNKCVHVTAPTGAAAYNIGGETLHRTAGIKVNNENDPPSEEKMKNMIKNLYTTVALIIDERSMISQKVLGAAERNIAMAAHSGTHSNEDWGGIPVVIMLGDDMQLPPVIERGAFDIMAQRQPNKSKLRQKQMPVEPNGYQQFLEFSKTVMELKGTKRPLDGQEDFVSICENIRNDLLSNTQADKIFELNLWETTHLTRQQKNEIKSKALYIYANVAPMQEHNYTRLAEISSSNNPVALIKAMDRANNPKTKPKKGHFKNTNGKGDILPIATTLCRGAQVQITNNLHPEWALYNGAIGTVIEVVFKNDHNPNCGHQPEYVVVEFRQYPEDAPHWLESKPTYIPIPPMTVLCNKKCCSRTQIPLSLAFAKTGHTFQGQQAGPSRPGQPPNAAEVIICDPGNRQFEMNNPGTLYSQVSRATTIGDSSRLNSAIYFHGPNITKHRFMNTTKKKDGNITEKVINRNKWITLLARNVKTNTMTECEKDDLTEWIKKTKITNKQITQHILNTAWRRELYSTK